MYKQTVFSVQGRHNLIRDEWKGELYKYITGIVKSNDQKLYIINGMPDHVHVLLSLKPDAAVSDLVRDIKANSSKFINEKRWITGKFQWQEGFGAFSYGHSQLDTVIKYIKDQEEHHRKKTFKEEYLEFLKKFNVQYNEQYLFTWIE
ncbi:MAG: IS200/IS605 family transposase [Candidatus Brocadiaceae baterium WH-1]|nr:MAG: IS200/IS605 family transposase [Candidatus Jettenia sp. AMX2]